MMSNNYLNILKEIVARLKRVTTSFDYNESLNIDFTSGFSITGSGSIDASDTVSLANGSSIKADNFFSGLNGSIGIRSILRIASVNGGVDVEVYIAGELAGTLSFADVEAGYTKELLAMNYLTDFSSDESIEIKVVGGNDQIIIVDNFFDSKTDKKLNVEIGADEETDQENDLPKAYIITSPTFISEAYGQAVQRYRKTGRIAIDINVYYPLVSNNMKNSVYETLNYIAEMLDQLNQDENGNVKAQLKDQSMAINIQVSGIEKMNSVNKFTISIDADSNYFQINDRRGITS